MSDSGTSSPPAPESDQSTVPPPSDTFSSPPPQTAQASDSSPPADGQSPSPPPSPPPPDESASPSPPPPSESPPPSPPPSQSSPPAESNSPPPSDSSPPSTPTPSQPTNSPPPPSDPTPSKSTPSSPPPSHSKKSPPPSDTSPSPPSDKSPPPVSDSPSPPSSDDSNQQSPPPPVSESPPSPIIPTPASPNTPVESPPTPNLPPAFVPPTASASNPPPSDSTPSFSLSPPRSDSRPGSSSPSNSPSVSNVHSGTVVGVAVAGVFIIAFIAMLFVCARRRRKRAEIYEAAHYMPAGTMSVKSEGYYMGAQHNINISNSGPADSFFAPQGPNSFTNNSYGSQRGIASHGGGLESGIIGGPNPYFSYEELTEMTNGFSSQNVLGEGGFGCVYKGWLRDGKEVAVKQLKAGSGQGEREFQAEVEIISRVHHRHLVSLVGYCISEHHRLLIYEFVPNKTLEHHLHGHGMPVLEWTKRLKIALGAAKGLAYLHEDCHPKIIHRDIKSANILLDDAFEAQVADFGLAKPSNDTHTHVSTRVMGTFGYMAPEYASSGKLTDRSDVFSFGVVLLELVTGRKPVDPTQPLGDESLVEWARPLLIRALETGDQSELVDPRLEKHYVESEMIRMIEAAAACVRHSAPKRPRMVQVARALDCEGEMSDLSNGVKYGQSTIYESGQYNQDIMRFRRMALGDSSEYDMYSGEFNNSREVSRHQNRDGSSGESETRAFTARNVNFRL